MNTYLNTDYLSEQFAGCPGACVASSPAVVADGPDLGLPGFGSIIFPMFVDFSLSRAANCDCVSVPRARRLMRHHARLRGWSCHFWHL